MLPLRFLITPGAVSIVACSVNQWLQSSVLVFPLLGVGEGYCYVSLVVLRCWMRLVSFLSCAPGSHTDILRKRTEDGSLLNGDAIRWTLPSLVD